MSIACSKIKLHHFCCAQPKWSVLLVCTIAAASSAAPSSWPAICDICLGVRMLPVLLMLRKTQRCQLDHTGRGPPGHRQGCQLDHTGRGPRGHRQGKRTEWSTIACEETFEFCLLVDVSFSFRSNHRVRAAHRVFKADVLRESKNRHGTRAVRSTMEVGRCQSSCAYCEAEFDLGKGKNRSKATYTHSKTKTITIIDTRIRIHTSTSRRVEVKSIYYRKRGSASYIVREVLSVREREIERYRERERERRK